MPEEENYNEGVPLSSFLLRLNYFQFLFLAHSHLNHGCLAGQYYIWVGRKKIILDQTPSLARSLGTFYTNHPSKMCWRNKVSTGHFIKYKKHIKTWWQQKPLWSSRAIAMCRVTNEANCVKCNLMQVFVKPIDAIMLYDYVYVWQITILLRHTLHSRQCTQIMQYAIFFCLDV